MSSRKNGFTKRRQSLAQAAAAGCTGAALYSGFLRREKKGTFKARWAELLPSSSGDNDDDDANKNCCRFVLRKKRGAAGVVASYRAADILSVVPRGPTTREGQEGRDWELRVAFDVGDGGDSGGTVLEKLVAPNEAAYLQWLSALKDAAMGGYDGSVEGAGRSREVSMDELQSVPMLKKDCLNFACCINSKKIHALGTLPK